MLLLALVVPPTLRATTEDPWEFLRDFTHVQGAISQVEEQHIGALFYKAEPELIALIIFPVDCSIQGCELLHPVAYAVFDAEGQMVSFHAEPGQAILLSKLTGFQIT
jgi:hypothetical protein